MDYLQILYLIVGGLIGLFIESFSITSLRENQLRAATLSSTLFMVFALIWFASYFIFSPPDIILIVALIVVLVLATLFFMPVGSTSSLKAGPVTGRFDERDVVFSREEYQPGSDRYGQYYSMHPEYRSVDDAIRKLPELLQPGGRYYDPIESARIDAIFDEIQTMTTRVDGPVSNPRQQVDPTEITKAIKQNVLQMGADDAGIAELDPMHVYSHVGRGPHPWGEPIVNNHRYVVAFSLEMRYDPVQTAPDLPITAETASRYLLGAQISIELAEYIRSLGYPARAHISGSNYQIILPAVAHNAGLGELGRMGYLISPRLGARIRLGAVTTDLPLVVDKPVPFGVWDFCKRCLKCAINCPAGAISAAGTSDVRGVHKWQLNAEQCLRYWRTIGTDCGICMKVCPYSHPPSFVHNIVRAAIRRSSFARTVSVWGDEFFYGRKLAVN
ncbi:MAG: reductive dehalogenase [Candidatus Zixiibacteriota bacterium]|nr:MAG: reductive dehalogenase [candidate division Zixibacteria bacterium]